MGTVRSSSHSAARRGVTVLELLLGVATCAVIALGYLLLVKPRGDAEELDTALQRAAKIHDAAEAWRRDNPSGCPTLSTLVHDQHLSSDSDGEDPWGSRFRVRCGSEDITVVSPGKDGRAGTGDDVTVPRSTS